MEYLLTISLQPLVWREKYLTFNKLLLNEKLCTVSRFLAFKKAVRLQLPLKSLGVEAACLLACLPKAKRSEIRRLVVGWVGKHKIPPTYQLVSEYIKRAIPKKKRWPTMVDWREYAHALQALCTEHQITFPPEPS
jgi:hypothetical protein